MNPDDALHESPDEGRRRTIVDMLIDGEAVDKCALRDALNDAATRDYFIDALLLRRLAVDMAPNTLRAEARPLTPAARLPRWSAAAIVALTTAVAGYTLGREHTVPPTIPESRTVEAARPSVPAPEPTRTIRFEPGKNWISSMEGQ
jgi:hypothetical protein